MLHLLASYMPHIPVFLAADNSCSKPIVPGGPGLYDGLCSNGSVDVTSLSQLLLLVTNVIRILLALSGALAVIFLIVGGIFFVTSAGNPSQIKRAREILTDVIVGLVIILVAYAVVTFIANGLS